MTAAKSAPVRERILDAALRVLGKSGMRTLAQPRVAREAGVPQGHLTYYFPKRLDLLAAVAARFAERLREEIPSLASLPTLASDAGATLGAAGRAGAMAFVAKLAKDRTRTRTLVGLLAAMEEEPALRREIAGHVATLRKLVAALVGKPDSDPDVDLALATLWGVGLLHFVIEDRTAAETDQLLAHFASKLEPATEAPKRRTTKGAPPRP